MWGAAVGAIHQTEVYAGADNSVTLPGFTRFDAAACAEIDEGLRLQLNVQNVLGREYFSTAHSNNNITPARRGPSSCR